MNLENISVESPRFVPSPPSSHGELKRKAACDPSRGSNVCSWWIRGAARAIPYPCALSRNEWSTTPGKRK